MSIDEMIEQFKQKAKKKNEPNEWALYHALLLFKNDIQSTYDTCATLEQFHKCFRQVDVTASAHSDMILWELISMSKIISKVYKH